MRSLKTAHIIVGFIVGTAAFVASIVTIASFFGITPKFNNKNQAEELITEASANSARNTYVASTAKVGNSIISKETSLEIERVDIYPFQNFSSVKIRAIINGIDYEFPSTGKGNWLAPNSEIREQTANLAPAPRYNIKFEVTKKSERSQNEIKLLSNETILYYGTPTSGQYSLRGFDPESSEKSGLLTAQLKYRIGPTN